jgi:hypothetical protein
MKRIMLFEQFNKKDDNGKLELVKLIDEDGKVLNKAGFATNHRGICDTEDNWNYVGGVTKDGILVGVNGGYLKEESDLAKKYPHLVQNVAMSKAGEMFSFAAGQKYENQTEFEKIGKFER